MKKKVNAAAVIRDIKIGLGDVPIMEKYDLAPTEYIEILERLRAGQAVKESEVNKRLLSVESSVVGLEARQVPRCYLVLPIRVHDAHNPTIGGALQDLSEKGFQLTDVKARPGETREFTVQLEDLHEYVVPFSFEAQCKWSRSDPVTGASASGFEIRYIAKRDLKHLRKLITLVSICDAR